MENNPFIFLTVENVEYSRMNRVKKALFGEVNYPIKLLNVEKKYISTNIDHTEPKFRYLGKFDKTPDVIFSFSIYTREVELEYQYQLGLHSYAKAIESNSNWKMVIYTDQYTYDTCFIKDDILNKNNSNIIFYICDWESYNEPEDPRQLDGAVLRVMRYRAIFDFKDSIVCVRDADTVFYTEDTRKEITEYVDKEQFIKIISDWETHFLTKFKETTKEYCFSSFPMYYKEWHTNIFNYKSTIFQGVLAGLLTVKTNKKRNEDLWNESLDFIKSHSWKIKNKNNTTKLKFINRNVNPNRVGMDEQILIFIWIPQLLDKSFFFFVDLEKGFGTKGKVTPENPNPFYELEKYAGTQMLRLKSFKLWDTKLIDKVFEDKTYETILRNLFIEKSNVYKELINSENFHKTQNGFIKEKETSFYRFQNVSNQSKKSIMEEVDGGTRKRKQKSKRTRKRKQKSKRTRKQKIRNV